MSETADVEACLLAGLGASVMDSLIWGHTEQTIAHRFCKLVSSACVCSLPLRIHPSAGWIQRRKRKLLHSDRSRVGMNRYRLPPAPLRNDEITSRASSHKHLHSWLTDLAVLAVFRLSLASSTLSWISGSRAFSSCISFLSSGSSSGPSALSTSSCKMSVGRVHARWRTGE